MAPRSEYAKSVNYDYASDASFDDGDEEEVSRDASTAPTDDNGYFASQGERAMNKLHELHASSDWKKVLKHKKGVVVCVQKRGGTTYRGQLIIKGYSPAAVFAVVGTRKLWDEWYESGSLVDNLNDTTSLTYMVMKGIVGSSTRDLSLVEKVEGSREGAIYFCSTSVESAKVPRVSGRVRAHIALNGWVMEPVKGSGPTSTQVSYYLQVNVKTFIPKAITGKYLARRPVCISRVDDYLQKNGAPPLAGVDAAEQQPRRSSSSSSARNIATGAAAGGAAGGAAGAARSAKRRSSMGSMKSGGGSSGLISAPSVHEEHKSAKDIQKGRNVFNKLSDDDSGWQTAQDHKGSRFSYKDSKGGFPIIKAQAKIENVTTEQVLSTILSTPARRIWDDRWMSQTLIEPVNGHEHGIYLELIKGIFPHVNNRYFVLAKGVERTEAASPNGEITYIARSTEAAEPKKKPDGTEAFLDVAGWRLEDEGSESIVVEHIVQTDMKMDKISEGLRKTMIVSVAKAPRMLREFIDDRGYAPFFVRWEEGEAHLDRDDGDMEQRKAEFYISTGSVKTKSKGAQRAWFQWSERMYERGISFKLQPSGAAQIAKVQGLDRTVEFSWNASKIGDGAKLVVEAYDRGDGAEDVMVDGELLDRTVEADEVADAAPLVRKPKKAKAEKANGSADPSGKSAAEGAALGAAAGGAAGAAMGSRGDKSSSKESPSSASGAGGSSDRDTGKRGPPDDAMIILSRDLYFTRTQVFTISALLAFSIVMARVI